MAKHQTAIRSLGVSSRRYHRRHVLQGSAALSLGLAGLSSRTRLGFARQDSSSLAGSVTMWAYPLLPEPGADETMWAGIAEDFNAEYPEVEVNVQIQPWDRRVEQLVTAMAANSGPDVWYINIEDIPNHASNGRLVPFDDLFSAEEKSDFLPRALDGLTFEDQLWAAPILMANVANFYNTNVFEQAGVTTLPETWDGLLEVAPVLKEAGFFVAQYGSQSAQEHFFPLVWQAGGDVYDSDNNPTFNSPEGVEALTFVVGLIENGYAPLISTIAATVPITETPLGQGEVAVGFPGEQGSQIKDLSAQWGEGAMQIAPVIGHTEQVSTGTVAGYAISSKAANLDAAAAWSLYITSTEPMTVINQAAGTFAPRVSVGQLHADDPFFGPMEEQLPLMRASPAVLGGRQIITDALSPEIEAAMIGEKTPQQALDDAVARAVAIMEEARSE